MLLTLWLLLADFGLAGLLHLLAGNRFVSPNWDVFVGAWTPVFFVAQMAVNGFPEEVFFRGLLLPDLLTVFRQRTTLALGVMMVLFNAAHIPGLVAGALGIRGIPWWQMGIWCIFPPQPVGLFFGYLYLRTRSLVPNIALHTFTTFWGIVP